MTRLLLFALGAALGYALRDPVCQRVHVEPRHLDPAIVHQPPEGDEGIQPPDPRTWLGGTITGTASAPPSYTITPTAVLGPRWPDTVEHLGEHIPGAWLAGCPLCEALRWQRR